jgi:hypothetical protein
MQTSPYAGTGGAPSPTNRIYQLIGTNSHSQRITILDSEGLYFFTKVLGFNLLHSFSAEFLDDAGDVFSAFPV